MSYKEWNEERLKSPWHQARIKKHGSWENYVAFISEKNKAGGYATKGIKKPGAGHYRKGDPQASINGLKGAKKRWAKDEADDTRENTQPKEQ